MFQLRYAITLHEDAIMQAVYTFAGTDQCSTSCQSMAHIAIFVNMYTLIRPVRPSTCNVVRNIYEHLIREPDYFQTLGWNRFIYGLNIAMVPKFFSVSSLTPPMA